MHTINAIGEDCPIPLLKAKNALKQYNSIKIIVNDESTAENLQKMATQKQLNYTCMRTDNEFIITLAKQEGIEEDDETTYQTKSALTKVILVSSNQMGEGSQELGETLLKSFIYTLTEIEQLPDKIIFYNSGVKFVADTSPSLESLRKLEKAGVEISACGACLNYYNLTDKVAVGSITNMLEISNIIIGNSSIIKV